MCCTDVPPQEYIGQRRPGKAKPFIKLDNIPQLYDTSKINK